MARNKPPSMIKKLRNLSSVLRVKSSKVISRKKAIKAAAIKAP
jgi:hypothetical protein